MIITPATYTNYFKQAAINNKLIGHNPPLVTHFYALSIEEILNDARSDWDGGFTMVLENLEANFNDLKNDNERAFPACAFSIIKQFNPKTGDYDDLRALIDQAYNICYQVISKIRKDYKNRILSGLEISSFHLHYVANILNSGFGYRCTFNFNQPASLGFDPTQWNNETPLQ